MKLHQQSSTFVWEWETSTLQCLGKAQALRVNICTRMYCLCSPSGGKAMLSACEVCIPCWRPTPAKIDSLMLWTQWKTIPKSSPQCEAPKIAKLVNITPISLWFMVLITSYNELVTGAFVNQRSHHVWGPHIVNHPQMVSISILEYGAPVNGSQHSSELYMSTRRRSEVFFTCELYRRRAQRTAGVRNSFYTSVWEGKGL